MKHLAWFSCGAASAVAVKLAVSMYDDVTVAYTDPGSEHPDNKRFIEEVQEWIGVPILRLKSKVYEDTWDVWEKRKFIVGAHGAPCTIELKKKMRWAIESGYDVQVFGYHAKETGRADRFREQNAEIILETPLIERGLDKADCLAMVERAGIDLPVMYKLGFQNNNCIGCPKGGMGYWNMIRQHFPGHFDRMADLERRLDHAVLKDDAGPVWLDQLDPTRGDIHTEPDIECSLLCAIAEDDYEATATPLPMPTVRPAA